MKRSEALVHVESLWPTMVEGLLDDLQADRELLRKIVTPTLTQIKPSLLDRLATRMAEGLANSSEEDRKAFLKHYYSEIVQ
jgi:hypothetical protein